MPHDFFKFVTMIKPTIEVFFVDLCPLSEVDVGDADSLCKHAPVLEPLSIAAVLGGGREITAHALVAVIRVLNRGHPAEVLFWSVVGADAVDMVNLKIGEYSPAKRAEDDAMGKIGLIPHVQHLIGVVNAVSPQIPLRHLGELAFFVLPIYPALIVHEKEDAIDHDFFVI